MATEKDIKLLVLKGIYSLTREGVQRTVRRLELVTGCSRQEFQAALLGLIRDGLLDRRGNLTFGGLAIAAALRAPAGTASQTARAA